MSSMRNIIVLAAAAIGIFTMDVRAQNNPLDGYVELTAGQIYGRWCFEERVEVIQTDSPEDWTNTGVVRFIESSPLFPANQRVSAENGADARTCKPKDIFLVGDRLVFQRDEDARYVVSLWGKRHGDWEWLLRDQPFEQWPSDSKHPVYWFAEWDGLRYFLFLAEQKNSVPMRVKFYYMAVFDKDCDHEPPPASVAPLEPGVNCRYDPPAIEQTDVGGGGERK